ncbi:MAG: PEGA domain-containing protein [Candidatus Eisenbacteria bacterium]
MLMTKRLVLLVKMVSAAGLAIVFLSGSSAHGQEPAASTALNQAIDLYWEGMFEKAVTELEGMIEGLEGENRVTAYEYLARSYIRLDDGAKGKAAYKELLRMAPEWKPDPNLVAGPEMSFFKTALTEYENENLGGVSVRTEPTRANVYLDGELWKEPTPVTLERVPAGEHVIRVAMDGWAAVDTSIVVAPADIATLDLVLEAEEIEPEISKSFWKSPWMLGAGGALGLGLIIAIAGGGGDGGGDDPGVGSDLPWFPDPPK